MIDIYSLYLVIGALVASITFIWFIIKPSAFKKLFVGSERISFNAWDALLVSITSIVFWPFFVIILILTNWKK